MHQQLLGDGASTGRGSAHSTGTPWKGSGGPHLLAERTKDLRADLLEGPGFSGRRATHTVWNTSLSLVRAKSSTPPPRPRLAAADVDAGAAHGGVVRWAVAQGGLHQRHLGAVVRRQPRRPHPRRAPRRAAAAPHNTHSGAGGTLTKLTGAGAVLAGPEDDEVVLVRWAGGLGGFCAGRRSSPTTAWRARRDTPPHACWPNTNSRLARLSRSHSGVCGLAV